MANIHYFSKLYKPNELITLFSSYQSYLIVVSKKTDNQLPKK
ncbi:hypothetical protein HMPREF9071_0148 [Capnocytophaga sp. oral taxon 338 str. F0234]|nr:hypothetical protein HMPREF9071_0148 [Capnocytophaga sp. oral taxon 338 str. F0234]